MEFFMLKKAIFLSFLSVIFILSCPHESDFAFLKVTNNSSYSIWVLYDEDCPPRYAEIDPNEKELIRFDLDLSDVDYLNGYGLVEMA